MSDKRNNYMGDVTTTETFILASPQNRCTIVTGIRLVNETSEILYGRVLVESHPVFVGYVPKKNGLYDLDTRIELLPGQRLSVIADKPGLKYFITTVVVPEV